jgi:hypothetical protein
MNTVAVILLAVAGVATALLVPALRSVLARTPTDAGADVTVLFLCVPRWIATSIVLVVVLARGGFDWIAGSPIIQAIAVFGTHLVLGFVFATALLAIRRRTPWISAGFWLLSIAVPLAVLAGTAWSLAAAGSPPFALRIALASLPVIAIAAAVATAIAVVAAPHEGPLPQFNGVSRQRPRRAASDLVRATH